MISVNSSVAFWDFFFYLEQSYICILLSDSLSNCEFHIFDSLGLVCIIKMLFFVLFAAHIMFWLLLKHLFSYRWVTISQSLQTARRPLQWEKWPSNQVFNLKLYWSLISGWNVKITYLLFSRTSSLYIQWQWWHQGKYCSVWSRTSRWPQRITPEQQAGIHGQHGKPRRRAGGTAQAVTLP